ncbi:MAG: Type secretion system pilin [Candidatus Parcubacteria bacterium]
MFKKTAAALIFTFVFFFFYSVSASFAQSQIADSFKDPTISGEGVIQGKGFVPCSGITCDLCDFMVMANTIIKWLFGMAFLFFAILAVRAGFKLVTEGNPGALQAAKQSFTNAFIGLIIFLCAWLLIDTLLHTLLKGGSGEIDGWGPWTKVRCTEQASSKIEPNFFDADPVFTAAQMLESLGPVDPALVGAAGVSTKADCSPAKLQSMGMNATQANVFSCIAEAESTCNNNPAPNPNSSASGMFQVVFGYNNSCHNLNLPQCKAAVNSSTDLNCSKAYSGGKPKAGMEAQAALCRTAASNQQCNVAAALCIYETENGYRAWLGTDSEPHPKQRACVAKFAN